MALSPNVCRTRSLPTRRVVLDIMVMDINGVREL